MNLDVLVQLAVEGRLYPSVILYGGSFEERQQAAVQLASALLCERHDAQRPCSVHGTEPCRHCRRLAWPAKGEDRFHPDLHVLERDLRATTSVGATKEFLAQAYASPFEARGQVYVIAEADTLGTGAADAFLKLLEEPPTRTPRNFILLTASQLDLLVTLRSRSLAVYLGSREQLDTSVVERVGDDVGVALDAYFDDAASIHLFSAADILGQVDGWKDPRARMPWALASAALLHYLERRTLDSRRRRALLDLAQDLLDGPRFRMRGITQSRLLEGWIVRRLGPVAPRST